MIYNQLILIFFLFTRAIEWHKKDSWGQWYYKLSALSLSQPQRHPGQWQELWWTEVGWGFQPQLEHYVGFGFCNFSKGGVAAFSRRKCFGNWSESSYQCQILELQINNLLKCNRAYDINVIIMGIRKRIFTKRVLMKLSFLVLRPGILITPSLISAHFTGSNKKMKWTWARFRPMPMQWETV